MLRRQTGGFLHESVKESYQGCICAGRFPDSEIRLLSREFEVAAVSQEFDDLARVLVCFCIALIFFQSRP